jgi:hypothetical protein
MKVSSEKDSGVKKEATKEVKSGGGKKGWRKAVDEVGSNVSDLSESTEDDGIEDDEGPAGSLADRSEEYENFEKMLRNKHSKACKAMSVS